LPGSVTAEFGGGDLAAFVEGQQPDGAASPAGALLFPERARCDLAGGRAGEKRNDEVLPRGLLFHADLLDLGGASPSHGLARARGCASPRSA